MGTGGPLLYLTDLMYYPTSHCSPSSSASFFMFFYAVCCSSTSFTVQSTSTSKYVYQFYMFRCIYLQCGSARKHVRRYPLGTCNTFSSFKPAALHVCMQSLQRTAHFSPALYVKLLELGHGGATHQISSCACYLDGQG